MEYQGELKKTWKTISGGSRLSHGTHRRQSEFDVIGLIYQALS